MSVYWFDAIGKGDTAGFSSVSAGTAVIADADIAGGYVVEVTAPSAGFVDMTGQNKSTFYIKRHIKITKSSNPSAQEGVYLLQAYTASAAIGSVDLLVETDGTVALRLINNVGGFTPIGSSFTPQLGVWYYLEMKCVVHASAGVLELRVNGEVVATGSSLNTGSTNLDRSYNGCGYDGQPITGAYKLYHRWAANDDAAYPGPVVTICRQGKAGTPTYDAWTKNGGATAAANWSETPYGTTNNCSSGGSGAAQTMLLASFSEGPGPTIGSSDTIVAVKQGMVAKRATGGAGNTPTQRRRVGGADTNSSAITLTTSDVYYSWDWNSVPSLTNLNGAEIGCVRASGTGQTTTVEDMWCFALVLPGSSLPRAPLLPHQLSLLAR